MKTCTKCKQVHPLTEFTKDRQKPDGLRSHCKSCVRAAAAEWRSKNASSIAKYWADYRKKNSEKVRIARQQWVDANRGRMRAKWRAFAKNNRHLFNEKAAQRRAAKKKATPVWADKNAIRQYYVLAAYLSFELGFAFEVDHIVPIQSELVCGLHTHTNLTFMPASWNSQKGNRYWPGMS